MRGGSGRRWGGGGRRRGGGATGVSPRCGSGEGAGERGSGRVGGGSVGDGVGLGFRGGVGRGVMGGVAGWAFAQLGRWWPSRLGRQAQWGGGPFIFYFIFGLSSVFFVLSFLSLFSFNFCFTKYKYNS